MPELTVTIPASEAGAYRIEIGAGLLGSLWDRVAAAYPGRRAFVVTDRALVEAGHLATLTGGHEAPTYVIDPPGEGSKHIQTVVAIVEAMERAYLGRDSLVLALGGGTVGDIAGFAAAIFKRGVPVVQIPTTSLAQADSAVGGKTGVDSSLSKNAFGAFWHPAAVFIDVETLRTQSEREYRSGLVESVKHALIQDAGYLALCETRLDAILARDPATLMELARRNVAIKGRVVAEDPQERNLRRILNYGHTIGHAAESASGFGLLHGEAVAIGMIGAGLIEQRRGLDTEGRLARVRKLLERLAVPTRIPRDLAMADLIDLIQRDKKAVNRWPRFVLLEAAGRVHRDGDQWAVDVDRALVERVLEELY